MKRTLTAAHLARLAEHLQPFEALRVRADGSVVCVRSYQARSAVELTSICADYARGDEASIVRRDAYWLIEFSRPLLVPTSDTVDG